MKLNLRLIIIAAAGAFLIALISGAVGGVPFGTILGRAILFAVVFAAFGAGVSILISRFLPELDASDQSAEEDHDVDIVIEGDEDDEQYRAAGAEDSPRREGDDELVDELEESPGEFEEDRGGSETRSRSSDVLDDVDDQALDRLPDLGGFASSFEGSNEASSEFSEESGAGESGPIGPGGEDPKLIARALQTMLKRDREKG